MPMSSGSRMLIPPPGTTPTRAWVSAKRARSDAMRKSHDMANSSPPVTAAPLIAPMTGVLWTGMRPKWAPVPVCSRSVTECSSAERDRRSNPAEKAGSAPVRIDRADLLPQVQVHDRFIEEAGHFARECVARFGTIQGDRSDIVGHLNFNQHRRTFSLVRFVVVPMIGSSDRRGLTRSPERPPDRSSSPSRAAGGLWRERRRTESEPTPTMKTTTTMMPSIDKATASPPSLSPWTVPPFCPAVMRPARPSTWVGVSARAWGTAAFTPNPVERPQKGTPSHHRGTPTRSWGDSPSLVHVRHHIRSGGSIRVLRVRTAPPSISQKGEYVDIALVVVDPFPPLKERLPREPCELRCALRSDIPGLDEEV